MPSMKPYGPSHLSSADANGFRDCGEAPNKRLKLTAPVVYGRIAFVNVKVWRRSLGAPR